MMTRALIQDIMASATEASGRSDEQQSEKQFSPLDIEGQVDPLLCSREEMNVSSTYALCFPGFLRWPTGGNIARVSESAAPAHGRSVVQDHAHSSGAAPRFGFTGLLLHTHYGLQEQDFMG